MKRIFITAFLLTSFVVQAQVSDSTKNMLSLSYDYSHFQKQFEDDWHITSLEYKRQLSSSALLGRINYGNRFHQSGWQGEIEAYPKLSKTVYAYAGIGFSNDLPIFPKWRTGTSLFVSLPKAWEVEGGFRHLHFTESVWLSTAGLSKYVGNWLFNIRSFISFEDISNNQSYFVSARRYFKNEVDHAWLQIGSGISPDESRNIQIGST
ncbi:MAG TPA: YaiO family outer membrane beta-barrel protein, partial [Flavisolibacter sp.]|nr:YaiO family outer membrane beta-barrel protein [Flavisolibacter sp.]